MVLTTTKHRNTILFLTLVLLITSLGCHSITHLDKCRCFLIHMIVSVIVGVEFCDHVLGLVVLFFLNLQPAVILQEGHCVIIRIIKDIFLYLIKQYTSYSELVVHVLLSAVRTFNCQALCPN